MSYVIDHQAQLFLSTLSLRRATFSGILIPGKLKFLSTLSLRRATRLQTIRQRFCTISIHALLAESDITNICNFYHINISIHALLAESDSTAQGFRSARRNFYPRSPCGERPPCRSKHRPQSTFLSTLSLRRATMISLLADLTPSISIHALLAESDTR